MRFLVIFVPFPVSMPKALAHSFISTVSSSACSYFTACSSASASTASSALAAMQGSRRAVVGDSVDMKQQALPV